MKKHALKAALPTLAVLVIAFPPPAGSMPRVLRAQIEVSTPQAKPAPTPGAKPLLNLNSATVEQLAALPGLGRAYAEKIIAGRPYKTRADLIGRRIIPPSVYLKIKNRIVAEAD